ncbi:hypothetical protein AB4Z52_25635 [Rhizobium sp. 2YAF20]
MMIGIGDITDTTTVTIGTGIGGIITTIATGIKGGTVIVTGINTIGGIAA